MALDRATVAPPLNVTHSLGGEGEHAEEALLGGDGQWELQVCGAWSFGTRPAEEACKTWGESKQRPGKRRDEILLQTHSLITAREDEVRSITVIRVWMRGWVPTQPVTMFIKKTTRRPSHRSRDEATTTAGQGLLPTSNADVRVSKARVGRQATS